MRWNTSRRREDTGMGKLVNEAEEITMAEETGKESKEQDHVIVKLKQNHGPKVSKKCRQ